MFSLAVVFALMHQPVQATPQISDSAGVRIVSFRFAATIPAAPISIDSSPLASLSRPKSGSSFQALRTTTAHLLATNALAVASDDANSVRFFDAFGTYRSQFGRTGKGPQEFSELTTVLPIGADSVLLQDNRAPFFYVVWQDGQRFQRRPLPKAPSDESPQILARTDNGALVTAVPEFGNRAGASGPFVSMSRRLDLYAPSGRRLGPLSMLVEREFEFATIDGKSLRYLRPFTLQGTIRTARNRILVGDGERFEVREYATNGTLVRILRANVNGPRMSEELKADERERFQELYRRPSRAALDAFWKVAQWKDRLPVYRTFEVDPRGHLWVALNGAANAPSRWVVFDENFRLLGGVDVPRAWEIKSIGRDRLSVVVKDEDGVEDIRAYRYVIRK